MRWWFAMGMACCAPTWVACAATAPPRASGADLARACAGIPESESRAGLDTLQADIERVDPLYDATTSEKGATWRPAGATIFLRATPGVTQQWLARTLECHVYRHAAGASCTKLECLLALPDVSTSVQATATGFAIVVRAKDVDVAKDVWRRTQLLASPPGASARAMREPAAS